MAQKSRSEQAGILVLGRTVATLSELLVMLAIVRLLGKVDVGILAGLMVVYQTVAPVAASGFPGAVHYFLPGRSVEERRAVAWKIAQALFLSGTAAAVLLAGIGLAEWKGPGIFTQAVNATQSAAQPVSLKYLVMLALYPLTDLPVRMLPNILIVESRPRAAATVGIVQSIGRSVATILPVALGANLWIITGSMVGFSALYSLTLLTYLSLIYRGTARTRSPVGLRQLYRFAMPLGMTEAAAVLNNSLDRWLIMILFPAVVLAEYQAGAWQIPFVAAIPYAVGAAYAPQFRELYRDGRPAEVLRIWRYNIQKVSLVVLPLTAIFIVGAEETVTLIFTESYSAAAVILRLYAILTLGRVTAFGSVLVAAGRPQDVFRAALFSLLANLALSIPLTLYLGFMGPALGTVLAFIPSVGFYCWRIARASSMKMSQTFPLLAYAKVLAITAVACGAAAGFKLWFDLPDAAMLAGEAVVVLSVFALVGTLAGQVTREDWRYAGDWLRLGILR